ncbi:MAG TPA: DinB family protein [Thermoanaerobaculia bacterium]|nr:DinB family protein [Thermoanaerobaculia bacterium]
MKSRSQNRDGEIALLLEMLDQAFDKSAWHGTNLRGSLRGIGADTAAWRPTPRRHAIWELTLHAAYWKYAVRRRLREEPRGSFELEGSNWFPAGDPADEKGWKQAVRLLSKEHRELRATVEELDPARLDVRGGTGKFTNRQLIVGAAAHDLYHTGQIQLLKKLRAEGR